MSMKKLMCPIILSAMLLTGCAGIGIVPAETQAEADSYVTQYSDAFSEKVKNTYSDDAHVKNIRGTVEQTHPEGTNGAVYVATGNLYGAIMMNNKLYNAIYYPDTQRMDTSVYTETIESELLNCLPFDKNSIKWSKLTNKEGGYPLFDSAVTSLDGAALTPCTMYMWIITDEDISGYTYDQIQSIEQLKRIANGKNDCRITIVSVTDDKTFFTLKSDIGKYDFSSDSLPVTAKSEDVFDMYHIRQSMYISFQNGNIKCNYLTK